MSFILSSPLLVAASPSTSGFMQYGCESLRIFPAKPGIWSVEPSYEKNKNGDIVLGSFCVYHQDHSTEKEEMLKEPLNGTVVGCEKGMYGFYCSSFYGNDEKSKEFQKASDYECVGPTDEFHSANIALLENQDWGFFPLGVVCKTPYASGDGKLSEMKCCGETVALRIDMLYEEKEANLDLSDTDDEC